MAPGQLWTLQNESVPRGRSLIDSIRNFTCRSTKTSVLSRSSVKYDFIPGANVHRGPVAFDPCSPSSELRGRRQNPLNDTTPLNQCQNRSGLNAFVAHSNELPPAYTTTPTTATSQVSSSQPSGLAVSVPTRVIGEDPFSFLGTFDTVLLIDDSGSMIGRSWGEVSQALATLALIITNYDSDGIDIYFLNHKSRGAGVRSDGIAATGFRGIKRAVEVTDIFERVRPCGGTPTGTRIDSILKPYLVKLENAKKKSKEVKPINLIVLTDSIPSDDVQSVLLSAAKKLDKLDAPPYQAGVQFFQVGNEEGAKEALEELDNELSNMVVGGVRDMVDTVTWTGGSSSSVGGIGLTSDGILKVCLGSLVRRLDRRCRQGDLDG